MKKILTLLLCISLFFSVSVSAFAEENTQTLNSLAQEYIIATTTDQETVYSNLQAFFAAAKESLPSLSNLDLAKFTLSYTGQSYDHLSEECILETLSFLKITTTTQFFRVTQDGSMEELTAQEVNAVLTSTGIAPAAEFITLDNCLKIITTASQGSTTSSGTEFILDGKATWLTEPTFRLEDTFALTYGGIFDDSYPITSTFSEYGTCSVCGKTSSLNTTEKYGPLNGIAQFIQQSDDIELDFNSANAIGTKFDLKDYSCIHYTTDGLYENFLPISSAVITLRFRIYASTTAEVRAAYAHKQVVGTLSISASVTPSASGISVSPVFSGTASITSVNYTAAPVTLRV